MASLTASYDVFQKNFRVGFFLVKIMAEKVSLHTLKDFESIKDDSEKVHLLLRHGYCYDGI